MLSPSGASNFNKKHMSLTESFGPHILFIWGQRFGNKSYDTASFVRAKRSKNPMSSQDEPKMFFQKSPVTVGLLKAKDIQISYILNGKLYFALHFPKIATAK